MFGIRDMDGFGLVHALIGIAALLLGLAVISLHKGTQLHRNIGFTHRQGWRVPRRSSNQLSHDRRWLV